MLRKLVLLAVAAILAFLGYVALQPPTGAVVRSAVIAAPASAIFPHVNDFHKWEAWSPWAKIDPNSKVAYEGAASGPGAVFTWAGNSEVGKGKMTITDSVANERISIKLDFEEPFPSASIANFTFKQEGDGTRVTWEMNGERNFLARVMCTIFNADKMVGGMFEKGLANLAAASGAKTP